MSPAGRSRRRGLAIAVVVAGFLAGLDLGAAPERQWSGRTLVAGVRLYQRTLSPWLASSGVECRFEPTCSHYGLAVLESHGALGGGLRAVWRILRCGPWTPAGTVDPPPPTSLVG